jgi:hypothetical protein
LLWRIGMLSSIHQQPAEDNDITLVNLSLVAQFLCVLLSLARSGPRPIECCDILRQVVVFHSAYSLHAPWSDGGARGPEFGLFDVSSPLLVVAMI